MKRKMISLVAAIVLFVGTAYGQMILTEEDYDHNRAEANPSNIGVMVPMQDVDYDQWKYVPLDGGMFLLAGLGAAYLMGKRNKNK